MKLKKSISEELIESAVKFHGHLGPFLILGLKAGLYATKVLGRDPFGMKVIVETEPKPPPSCFVDGVQFTTGCTMGKGNIELKSGEGLSAIFTRNERKVKLKLKEEFYEYLKRCSKEDLERIALDISDKPIHTIFNVKSEGDC